MTTDRDARQYGNRFIPLTNSWHSIDEIFTCCPAKCINSNIHSGQCENNGYIRVQPDGVVRYFSTNIDARNKFIKIYAERPFRKEACYQGGYCFYYFEVSMIEIANRESSSLFVGVKNDDIEVGVMFDGNEISVIHNQRGQIRSQHNWSSNDVIGVGLVFPPGGNLFEEPHLFLTLNGLKIGN
uniref:SPRY domain-containing protein n=1 Tax=Meloidogyne hapla TaxID=6305 RepID=A0A1I8B3X1_MELHA